MILFDGKGEAARRKTLLQERQNAVQVAMQKESKKFTQLKIFSLIFQEDKPSIIYANLKQKDAESLGIVYEQHLLPIATPVEQVVALLKEKNADSTVTGIIVQKPAKSLFPFPEWWSQVVAEIVPNKDVDGLTPQSLVLPATARAILAITDIALHAMAKSYASVQAIVLGRSDIVGKPVAVELTKKGCRVQLFGRQEFALRPQALKEANLVVAATGQADVIHANLLSPGVIAIDAGSPFPEINPAGLDSVAAFLSPVPGGVGPMTRICLLENLFDLVQLRS